MARDFSTGNLGTKPASVTPYLRVVPNGIVSETDDQYKFKATLLITPEPCATGTLQLESWPTSVAGLLKNPLLKDWLKFGVIKTDAKNQPLPGDSHLVSVQNLTFPGFESWAKHSTDLTSLWAASFLRDSKTEEAKARIWTRLCDNLLASLRGSGAKPGNIGDKDEDPFNGALDDGAYGENGQLEPQTNVTEGDTNRVIDTVLSAPHADLAIALEAQRVVELLDSLKRAGGDRVESRPGKVSEFNGTSQDIAAAQEIAATDIPDEWEKRRVQPFFEAFFSETSSGTFNGKKWGSLDPRERLIVIGCFTPLYPDLVEVDKVKPFRDRVIAKVNIIPPVIPGPVGTELDKAISDARIISLKEAQRQQRIAHHAGLSAGKGSAVPKQRAAAKKAYNAQAPETDDVTSVCDFDALTPEESAQKGKREIAMLAAQDVAEYGSWAEYKDAAKTKLANFVELNPQRPPEQTFFAIEGSPSLSRAFGLAFDITFEVKKAEFDQVDLTNYLLISASIPGCESKLARPWTLAKLRSTNQARHFWPATISEYRLQKKYLLQKNSGEGAKPIEAHCLSQFEGLFLMGSPNQAGVPRFDVTSLDVRAAAEAERNRRATYKTEENTPEGAKYKLEKARIEESYTFGPAYQTTGLTILNRGVRRDVIRNLASRTAKAEGGNGVVKKSIILDADDLTNGFRLVIGTPDSKSWQTIWAPMMARWMEFGTSGKGGKDVEAALVALELEVGSDGRIALETSLQTNPGRLLPSAFKGDGSRKEIFLEEVVAVWDGGPMGVDCSVTNNMAEKIEDTMIFGRTLNVPNEPTGSSHRLPRFRYGRPYRFAMLAVFAGGHSVPYQSLPKHQNARPADKDIRANLYYPPDRLTQGITGAHPYLRGLRHDKIGAPTVLMPKGQALMLNGVMGYQHSNTMIVRSLQGVDDADSRDKLRARPVIAQRLIVSPSLPQEKAVRHHLNETKKSQNSTKNSGVFDNQSGEKLKGGLSHLNYTNGVGFPKTRTTTRKGVNGQRFLDTREKIPNAKSAHLEDGEEIANPLYDPSGTIRDTDYFPDPAAEYMAIAVRRKGGTENPARRWDYLEGEPEIVDLSADGAVSYPGRRAVLLSLRSEPKSSRPYNTSGTQKGILSNIGRKLINAHNKGDIVGGGGAYAHEIELRLEPGEQYDVDMWVVPSFWRMAHDFAIVQAFGTYLVSRMKKTGVLDIADIKSCLRDLGLPGDIAETIYSTLDLDGGGVKYVAPGGVLAPSTKFLLSLAKGLHTVLRRRPLPEFSGVQTISVAHAVNRPKDKPKIEGLDQKVDPFAVNRFERPSVPAEEPRPIRALRPADLPEAKDEKSEATVDQQSKQLPKPLKIVAQGSRSCLLAGTVDVDLERVDTLEIQAILAHPGTTRFDDPARGRSLYHRRAGTWPKQLANDNNDQQKAADVFGFRLGQDGRTEFEPGKVTLLRIEGLPYPTADRPDRIELFPFFEGTQTAEQGSVSYRHSFPDGKARVMKVRVNGLSRTAGEMTTAARVAHSGDPWTEASGEGLIYKQGELIPRAPLSQEMTECLSEEITVVLPATIRPSPPDARGPVPVFLHDSKKIAGGGYMKRRMTRIRIPLGRAWFSSGEDERLGIVLWPPNMNIGDHDWLAQNVVALRNGEQTKDKETKLPGFWQRQPDFDRLAEVNGFSDEDLGPGGIYVTRRGSDPVRIGKQSTVADDTQVFLSRQDFADLWTDENDLNHAEFVPDVAMPIIDMGDEARADGKKTDADDETPALPPMNVSLVTYRPLFDPVREEWYVDVHLRPGPSADPFVRLGLVRYQKHTIKTLRCSRPVVQWVQPIPNREVILSWSEDKKLVLSVSGPASKGRAIETAPGGSKLETQQEVRDEPIMRVTVFEEGIDAAGLPLRHTIDLREQAPELKALAIPMSDGRDDFDGTLRMVSTVQDGWGDWTLTLDQSLLEGRRNVKVLVEEVDLFLPATFDTEPLQLEDIQNFKDTDWRATGPRFSAILELSELGPAPPE